LLEQKKKCLVLGGSGYIGSQICRQLKENGADISFTYFKNNTFAKELSDTLSCKAYQIDFCDIYSIQNLLLEAIQELNGVDAIIQCAGTAGNPELYSAKSDKFLDISEDDFSQMLMITTQSSFIASQVCVKTMKEKGGEFIIVGSMDGVKSVPAPIHYAAAKGALVSMCATLAKELGKKNIRVNLIAPGILEGGIAKYLSKELKEDYLHHCSLKRLGKANEVANLVCWLVSQNSYVTGQTILLDGAL
jgi:3-oxoacyl-[acyl-carrier protein] reductase